MAQDFLNIIQKLTLLNSWVIMIKMVINYNQTSIIVFSKINFKINNKISITFMPKIFNNNHNSISFQQNLITNNRYWYHKLIVINNLISNINNNPMIYNSLNKINRSNKIRLINIRRNTIFFLLSTHHCLQLTYLLPSTWRHLATYPQLFRKVIIQVFPWFQSMITIINTIISKFLGLSISIN